MPDRKNADRERYKNDPVWREEQKRKSREWMRKKYQTDAVWREETKRIKREWKRKRREEDPEWHDEEKRKLVSFKIKDIGTTPSGVKNGTERAGNVIAE